MQTLTAVDFPPWAARLRALWAGRARWTVRGLRATAAHIAAFSLLACGHTSSYAPLEPTGTVGATPASMYDIRLDGQVLGHVKVWSLGGYTLPTDGKAPVISVGVRTRNLSDKPMTFDVARSQLEITTKKGAVIALGKPYQVQGDASIPAGQIGHISITYALPQNIKPGDVVSFDFDWLLTTADGLFSRSTPFVKIERAGVPYYWPGYYGWYPDSWYIYGGFGPSWWGSGWWGYGPSYYYWYGERPEERFQKQQRQQHEERLEQEKAKEKGEKQ